MPVHSKITPQAVDAFSLGVSKSLIADLNDCRKRARKIIAKAGKDTQIISSAVAREKAYNAVKLEYSKLSKQLAKELEQAGIKVTNGIAKSTAAMLPNGAKPAPIPKHKWNTALNGKNVDKFVAVATHKMSESAVKSLRGAVVSVMVDAKEQGLTDNEIHKAIQTKWDETIGNENSDRFIDKSGRHWDNARYLQMLTRTTMSKLSRETESKTFEKNGIDLVMISGDSGSEQCDVCARWEGVVVSLTGKTAGYPTLADAEADGLFHPNCTHRIEYLTDEEIAEKGIIDPREQDEEKDDEDNTSKNQTNSIPIFGRKYYNHVKDNMNNAPGVKSYKLDTDLINNIPKQIIKAIQNTKFEKIPKNSNASYSPFYDKVYIVPDKNHWSGAEATVSHEIGHVYYYKKVSQIEKDRLLKEINADLLKYDIKTINREYISQTLYKKNMVGN